MPVDAEHTVAQKRRNSTPPTPGHSTAWRRGKLKLLSREQLDGRTKVRQQFDAIAAGIAQDLGGEDQLSTIQRHLVEAFAGTATVLNHLNAQCLLGEPLDISDYAQTVSTLVRLASRLGVERLPHEIDFDTFDLDESTDGEARS